MKSFVDAWTEQAADLRRRAEALPPGEERDHMLVQAEKLDAAVDMTKMLSVSKTPPSK